MAVATPGQALTAVPPGGLTCTRLTTSATASPPSAMAQPAYTSGSRLRASSAPNAGRRRPAVTQAGGSPGPPGRSSSTDSGLSAAAASPGRSIPASRKNADGLVTRWKVHGTRTAAGTTATIAALITAARPSRGFGVQAAATPTAARIAIGHTSGTKAAATAVSRPAAHAARRARLGGPVSIRPAAMPMSGSRTKATAVPMRPAATAPIATGSSA